MKLSEMKDWLEYTRKECLDRDLPEPPHIALCYKLMAIAEQSKHMADAKPNDRERFIKWVILAVENLEKEG